MSKPKLENMTIYTHWISMPCRFLQMVIRELDIDCNFHEIDFFGREHAKPEYQAINPAQLIPALKDGDLCIAESRAIACYICNRYAPDSDLYPKDPARRAKVDYALYADAEFVEVMFNFTKLKKIFSENAKPDLSDDRKVRRAFSIFESLLSRHKYLAADHMTLADLSAINSIAILENVDYSNFTGFPLLQMWVETMKKLPYYEEFTGIPNKQLKAAVQKKLSS